MSCNIIYKNGKLEEVRADNGSPSILFQRAKQIFGEETAKEIFYVSKSDQFQEVFKATIEVYKQKLLNKFNNLTNEQADRALSAVEEMQSIKDKAIADGTFMKAPNGQPTNLNEQQWLQVRTKSFKDFFGDWINDPQNASKVVDSQGEPMVVFHGTNSKTNFTEFEAGLGKSSGMAIFGKGIYFSDSFDTASKWGFKAQSGVDKYKGVPPRVISSFLNIKNPNYVKWNTKEYPKNSKNLGYDGVYAEVNLGDNIEFVVFESNQIKSAEENIGTFSTETNDIRFRKGENQGQLAEREVIDRLKQKGSANNVFAMNTQEIHAKAKEFSKKDIKEIVNGFVHLPTNNIYINTDVATNETAIHEFSHLYNSWLKQSRPELYNRGLELVKAEVGFENVEELSKNILEKYPSLKTLFLSENNNIITIDMIEVSKDNRSSGVGSSVMNEIINYADKKGMILDLVPSIKDSNIGTTSRTRLIKFYKKFGFVENKGKNKDFVRRSGGMYRLSDESKKSEIQDIINFVKTTQPILKGEALLEEILTELTGRR